MSDHFIQIYTHRAAAYHRFIAVEDVEENLLKAIEAVTPLQSKRLLDLGTGTGRLPLLLKDRVAQIVGVDLHWDMLRQNAVQRGKVNGHWPLVQADIRQLPFASQMTDIVTAGWAIGHFCGWYANDWQTQIGRAIKEMKRLCASGGVILIFETLSTGSLTPAPPTPALANYYAWLEGDWGFKRTTFSTDYQFENVEQAVEWTEFFFGEALSEKIRANNWARLPEWTGMWSLKLSR